eukprot:TRINITY_DN43828_c0_g1_i1.p1 TRINITY_DN43828_c0_g1~~TRINITY_DN43828_c0_g1_i1.p1  ORF type:complete len:393 (+),score=62.12 TRINITY_DN43828_c0_g1_i1:217-1395(+)
MPFAQKPFKPKPEVELLRRRRLTFEDATALVQTSLKQDGKQSDGGVRDDASMEVPGVALVSFQHIPTILQTMEQDWLTWPKDQRQCRSCFVEVTGRVETHLHPCFLSRLDHGLRVAAGFMLHRWVERLGCIPLCFVELKPAGTHAAVVAESPYAHFLMHFRAVGFAPQKGDWLVGRMNQTQISAGMNVTVLGLVNCFIRKANLPEEIEYIEGEGWRHKNSTGSDSKGSDAKVRSLDQVWLQLDLSPQAAKMRSNSAPDLKCVLGWPSEQMPATLRKARAAGKAPKLAKQKDGRGGRGSGRGRGAGEGSKQLTSDSVASPPSKRKSGRMKTDRAEPADVAKPSGSGGRGQERVGRDSDAHDGGESRPAKTKEKKEKRNSTASAPDEPSKKRRR